MVLQGRIVYFGRSQEVWFGSGILNPMALPAFGPGRPHVLRDVALAVARRAEGEAAVRALEWPKSGVQPCVHLEAAAC